MLYVAFTRASDALYCLSDQVQGTGSGINGISKMLYNICKGETGCDNPENNGGESLLFDRFYNKEQNIFEYGILKHAEADKEPYDLSVIRINEYPAQDSRRKLKIAYQSSEYFGADTDITTKPLSYGKVMHEIFSNITTIDDVENAIEKIFIEGKIKLREKASIHNEVTEIFKDPRIRSWFSNNYKVITEKDIILPDGSVRRPDRVLIKADSAIIIDYKFGIGERNEYLTQIREYALYLKEMGYNNIESFIWYINKGKIVKA
jgi:ATP-dependent helicase/nuclease subunit A